MEGEKHARRKSFFWKEFGRFQAIAQGCKYPVIEGFGSCVHFCVISSSSSSSTSAMSSAANKTSIPSPGRHSSDLSSGHIDYMVTTPSTSARAGVSVNGKGKGEKVGGEENEEREDGVNGSVEQSGTTAGQRQSVDQAMEAMDNGQTTTGQRQWGTTTRFKAMELGQRAAAGGTTRGKDEDKRRHRTSKRGEETFSLEKGEQPEGASNVNENEEGSVTSSMTVTELMQQAGILGRQQAKEKLAKCKNSAEMQHLFEEVLEMSVQAGIDLSVAGCDVDGMAELRGEKLREAVSSALTMMYTDAQNASKLKRLARRKIQEGLDEEQGSVSMPGDEEDGSEASTPKSKQKYRNRSMTPGERVQRFLQNDEPPLDGPGSLHTARVPPISSSSADSVRTLVSTMDLELERSRTEVKLMSKDLELERKMAVTQAENARLQEQLHAQAKLLEFTNEMHLHAEKAAQQVKEAEMKLQAKEAEMQRQLEAERAKAREEKLKWELERHKERAERASEPEREHYVCRTASLETVRSSVETARLESTMDESTLETARMESTREKGPERINTRIRDDLIKSQVTQKCIFDPTRTEGLSYEKWKKRLGLVEKATRADEYSMQHWVETNLTGEASKLAERWFKIGTAWREVLEKLDDMYLKPEDKGLVEEYTTLRQEQGESIRMFADKMENLSGQIHEDMPAEKRVKLVKQDLVNRLRDTRVREKAKLKLQKTEGEKWTLKELVEWCEECEANLRIDEGQKAKADRGGATMGNQGTRRDFSRKTVERERAPTSVRESRPALCRACGGSPDQPGPHCYSNWHPVNRQGGKSPNRNGTKCFNCNGTRSDPVGSCKARFHRSQSPEKPAVVGTVTQVRSTSQVKPSWQRRRKRMKRQMHEFERNMAVCGRKRRVLCDTGSAINIVSEKTANQLLRMNRELNETETEMQAQAVNGTRLEFRGMIQNVRVKHGDRKARITVYIQRDASVNMLLGRASLKSLGIGLSQLAEDQNGDARGEDRNDDDDTSKSVDSEASERDDECPCRDGGKPATARRF